MCYACIRQNVLQYFKYFNVKYILSSTERTWLLVRATTISNVSVHIGVKFISTLLFSEQLIIGYYQQTVPLNKTSVM